MQRLSKQIALQILAELRGRTKEVLAGPQFSSAYDKWIRDIQAAYRNLFGADSPHLSDLKSISFSPGIFSTGTPDQAFTNSFRSGVVEADAAIASAIDEVSQFWPESTPPQAEAASIPKNSATAMLEIDPSRVFVVHGRNLILRDELYGFLRAIGLRPLEWSQAVALTRHASPYIGDVLDEAFDHAQAVIVLLTPDDEAKLRDDLLRANDPPHEKQLTPQARANVLFEAGMAMGRSAERTILVEIGEMRPFSDVAGRHAIRLNNSSSRRQELAQRLENAGCAVDLSGTDWHTAGNFDVESTRRKLPGSMPRISSAPKAP